ncbi:DUF6575 domain-containing protein [Bacillus sp. NPDC094106]|uniref:DUF6575 domain-containing protein n=1 Tax=Bacillus sp. NPDC094106 TaxID=3363949 RepID=UPI003828B462
MCTMTMDEYLNLITIHIFDYYDFPLFFITKTNKNQYYLNYYVEGVNEYTDKWFFSEISNDERLQLIEQRISSLELLKRLLKNQRLYYLFVTHAEGSQLKFEQINQDNLDPDGFPEKEYFVEYDFVSQQKLNSPFINGI